MTSTQGPSSGRQHITYDSLKNWASKAPRYDSFWPSFSFWDQIHSGHSPGFSLPGKRLRILLEFLFCLVVLYLDKSAAVLLPVKPKNLPLSSVFVLNKMRLKQVFDALKASWQTNYYKEKAKKMTQINAWAAHSPAEKLVPYKFDAGQLGAEEVEVEVEYCGLCHSDVSVINNEWGLTRYPLVPGHEIIGTVVALGEQAKGLEVGQRVGIGWNSECDMYCKQCLSGNQHLCSK